jgi:hypothetical protein
VEESEGIKMAEGQGIEGDEGAVEAPISQPWDLTDWSVQ